MILSLESPFLKRDTKTSCLPSTSKGVGSLSSQYSTPINGLYLCSAGTHPGGGVTGINGINAAKQLLKDKRNG